MYLVSGTKGKTSVFDSVVPLLVPDSLSGFSSRTFAEVPKTKVFPKVKVFPMDTGSEERVPGVSTQVPGLATTVPEEESDIQTLRPGEFIRCKSVVLNRLQKDTKIKIMSSLYEKTNKRW